MVASSCVSRSVFSQPTVFFEIVSGMTDRKGRWRKRKGAAARNLIRVVDESGDDYRYPAELARALRLAS
jgi:hypothetical protein